VFPHVNSLVRARSEVATLIIPESSAYDNRTNPAGRLESGLRVTWAVTFDFHNTLARCDEWFQLEVHDLLPAFLDWRARVTGRAVTGAERECSYRLYRRIRERVMASGEERDAESCLRDVLDEMDIDVPGCELSRGLEELFRSTLTSTSPQPGAVDAIRDLHALGVQLAVVSSAAYHPFLEWTLAKFGIAGCFEALLTSASTGHYKSTQRIYEIAADSLARDPRHCIHIGDSPQFDVESAREAGMRTVLVDWFDEFGETTIADLRVMGLDDLVPQLVETFGVGARGV
jgi:putative hydrolase of the HAD superfamily